MRTTFVRPTLLVSIATLSLAIAPLAAPVIAQEAPSFEEVDGLRVTELTIASSIEAGQAIDPRTTFRTSDGRVMVLIRVENHTGAETDIRVSFERADREIVSGTGGLALHIPARPRYRTVARTGTRAPGRFRVVVRTSAGNVLASAEYEVSA